jgi:hypothetical protein
MLTDPDRPEWTEEDLTGPIIRLNDTILALVLGLVTGLAVFVATIWLVIKGGDPIGPHLALLSQFFPGYSVSFVGSVVGLAYGAVLGALAGWSIAWMYNWIAFRHR